MRILMMTNTYLPHVGGVARSVSSFENEFRRLGHEVLVVAPEFENMPPDEDPSKVIRVPAIQKFNGSDFSVQLPLAADVIESIDAFRPDIVHSHHPFLLGDAALRAAARNRIPLVFTHHTLYEQYTHYAPGDSPALKRFVVSLVTGYCNLCQLVVAPSESIEEILRERGVSAPVEVVPTGLDLARFAEGDGEAMRDRLGVPRGAFVVGHAGRLAPEKNLGFLARAVAAFLWRNPAAHFIVAGAGPAMEEMRSFFEAEGMETRVHFAGVLTGRDLADAYCAMNVFAFASKTETQGIVLAEAMACGLPVAALDASGTREVVRDGVNGFLLERESMFSFASALELIAVMPKARRDAAREAALATAREFSIEACARRILALYERAIAECAGPAQREDSLWDYALRMVKVEWDNLQRLAGAAGAALAGEEPMRPSS